MSNPHPTIYITDTDYADDLAITSDNVKDANTMLHKISEYISLNRKNNNGIRSLNGKIIKKVHDSKYFVSYVASTNHDVNVKIGHAWAALNNITSIWKSNLSVKLKTNIVMAMVNCSQLNRSLYMAPSHGQ